MSCLFRVFFLLALLYSYHASIARADELQPASIAELMPQPQDETSMWWRDGFAGIIEDASWRRVIRTGNYWYLLDTDTVTIPRLGPVSSPIGEIGGVDLNLKVRVNGKSYRCRKGADWSLFEGPRLIESGQFLQRTDVRGLEFVSDEGDVLNAEARFESAAWPDQLGMSLAVRPGTIPFLEGEKSGGRVTGGFGLTGKNQFKIAPNQCSAGAFTLSFWVFVPADFKAGKHSPWLVCQNLNETVNGNFGIMLNDKAVPTVRMNLGGGTENAIRISSEKRRSLAINQWNHVALSYDNDTVILRINERSFAQKKIGKIRKAKAGGLAIGGREDGLAGFEFHGVIDEILLFDRALSLDEIRRLKRHPEANHSVLKPKASHSFKEDLPPLKGVRRDTWKSASIEIGVGGNDGRPIVSEKWQLPEGTTWSSGEWKKSSVTFDPQSLKAAPLPTAKLTAVAMTSGKALPISFETDIGCHRIDLDKVQPSMPEGTSHPPNDQMERVRIRVENPSDKPEIVRLMFNKTKSGFWGSPGRSITGISAILRDAAGNPTGIPVQLSKNWHNDLKGGQYAGLWFHGFSQLRLPANKSAELELSIAYAHWGGVAAASHAQLSLIGYGGNHLWEQSAIGSWGESVCYNPEQVFGACNVTDIRPLMVKAEGDKKWNWTENVGGADFLRMFDTDGKRVPHASVQSKTESPGPCLTKVIHSGSVGRSGIQYNITSSLPRTDDLVRTTWRIRMHVSKPVEFSRFVFFQAGSDKYAYTVDRKMAVGNIGDVFREWLTKPGGNAYRGKPIECDGVYPWASLHYTLGEPSKQKTGWATRGMIIRNWNAKIGGKPVKPWIAEHGSTIGRRDVSTMDIVPPPDVREFLPGDYLDATIEFVVIPQYAKEYYGPNQALRNALAKNQDTWKMVLREAVQGHLKVDMRDGNLERLFPGIHISTVNDAANFKLKGGLGYIPITFSNLSRHSGYSLKVDGIPVDQSVHGRDFWQTNFDPRTKRWSQTYNLQAIPSEAVISFGPAAR